MMHMEQRLAQTQTQRLMLTQKMQQAIQVLQMNTLELQQHVQQELEMNPVLEQVVQEPGDEAFEDAPEHQVDDSSLQFEDGSFDWDQYASQIKDYKAEGTDFSRNRDMDSRRDYYEQSITKEDSLLSRLCTQLELAARDKRQEEIGMRILGEIDGKGYFAGSLEGIAEEMGATVDEVRETLRLIQTFDPIGVGARSVVECLLLQVNAHYPGDRQLYDLVAHHLEDLEHRQIPKIARAMRIAPERVEELKSKLATLNPWPGHEYDSAPPQYVQPDVIVEKDEEDESEYRVYLTDETSPVLRTSNDYRHMMKTGQIPKEDKKFLREKFESARWLIRNIEQRKRTILRIATAIVEVQKDFFEKGVEHIKPLTLQEIAEKVGVHEATVSRTARGKYMQTPQGLFEMKYFFSPGLKTSSGDEQSSKSVQSVIKKIIKEEDKRKPLSDQKIADALKEQGIQIARRTVTKYREAMGILPTNLRRSYNGKA